jgi:hypothetical protein
VSDQNKTAVSGAAVGGSFDSTGGENGTGAAAGGKSGNSTGGASGVTTKSVINAEGADGSAVDVADGRSFTNSNAFGGTRAVGGPSDSVPRECMLGLGSVSRGKDDSS